MIAGGVSWKLYSSDASDLHKQIRRALERDVMVICSTIPKEVNERLMTNGLERGHAYSTIYAKAPEVNGMSPREVSVPSVFSQRSKIQAR